jgi:nucleoside-diphosphate-sugar epimerase
MRVFVAGASGTIGRPLVRRLVAAGHEVTGMTRRERRAEEIRAAGAAAVICDVYDEERLREVVVAAEPEGVVHALTALPQRFNPKKDYLAATSRLRTEGTRSLLAAARAAGTRRVVAESIAFLYRGEGDWVKDEQAPVETDAPGFYGPAFRAALDLERQVTGAEGIEGIALRCGWLYGPGTFYDRDGQQAEEMRRRRLPIVGRGTGTFSFIHVDDLAEAIAAALERGAPGVYNVADDEPAPMSEWLPVYAEALGAKPPRRVPVWLAALVAGRAAVGAAIELRGASNAKARRELDWQPAHPSWRRGFGEMLDIGSPL